MAVQLKLMPIRQSKPIAVVQTGIRFRVVFENNTQCLIDPEPEPGSRRLYAFSREIIEHSPWIDRYDDLIIVAKTLTFFVVGDRRYSDTIHTLLCEYKGWRS